jgi:hypothetical protein
MSRYAILNQIRQLDPEQDHQQIVFLMGAYEAPFLIQRALEFALFRTYAVPSIAKLLDQTGEFAQRGQQRYDDTSLIIAEFTENGYDSERGRAALKRMNRLHGRFDIGNDDYLYVLSTFIYEPIRWNARFGWRPLDPKELQAEFIFWREIGRRMGIKNIPETYEAFEQFNVDYERTHFRYSEESRRVGEATMQVFLRWYPAILRPLIRPALYAFMDKPLRDSFGFPEAPAWAKALAIGAMKVYGRALRWLPPRRKPRRFTQEKNRTYPNGYQIEQLGPPGVERD